MFGNVIVTTKELHSKTQAEQVTYENSVSEQITERNKNRNHPNPQLKQLTQEENHVRRYSLITYSAK